MSLYETNSEDIYDNPYTKEKLKNIKYLKKFLNDNNPDLYRQLENFEYLDSGGESNIYKVTIKKTNTICVMKLIIKEKRNFSEINISKKLKHKNIIDLIYHTPLNNTESDIIILQYGTNGDLRNFIKKLNRICYSETMLCYIAYQVLNALKYCKIQKIVHYDIKPANIIIDDMLNIKLIDFSISLDYSQIDTNDIKLVLSGTPYYIPPEVIKKETIKLKDVNKIDIYSLGVTLYKLSFCCYPYDLKNEDSGNYDKIYNKIMNNNLEINNENNKYSQYFINFLLKLLEKDITKRINIDEALEDWIQGAYILMDYKEELCDRQSFIINLICDHIYEFNKYIKK